MNVIEDGTQARVLATALRHWSSIDADTSPIAARIQIRQPPTWEFAGTVNVSGRQLQRILGLLRDDIAEQNPGLSSPERAAAVIAALLAEHRAAGHTTITARDLVAAAPRIGRPIEWIAAHLVDLADAGQIQETWRPSVFRIA